MGCSTSNLKIGENSPKKLVKGQKTISLQTDRATETNIKSQKNNKRTINFHSPSSIDPQELSEMS